MRRRSGIIALTLAAALAGCENPADNKPKATVAEAKPEAPAPESAAAAIPAGALVFSGEGSKVDFAGSKVTGRHDGGFKTFTGTIELAPDKPEVARLTADIDMNSTWSDNERLTGHLKSPDFFDVKQYPRATFVSTEIKPGGSGGATHTVTGNFTLHGVTKSISFPTTIEVGDASAAVRSEFVINRKDFGIVYPGKPDDLIRDEVVIKLDLKASKSKPQQAA